VRLLGVSNFVGMCDFPSTLALEKQLKTYFDELNRHPKPMQWTYTKTKLLAKFGAPQPAQLAA